MSREPELTLVQPGDTEDPYVLRGLLWCGLCDVPLVAALVSTGERQYGCINRRCPRPLVPAEVTEQRVWNRFASRHWETARGVRRYERRAVLCIALERVRVGERATQLHYDWQDPAP